LDDLTIRYSSQADRAELLLIWQAVAYEQLATVRAVSGCASDEYKPYFTTAATILRSLQTRRYFRGDRKRAFDAECRALAKSESSYCSASLLDEAVQRVASPDYQESSQTVTSSIDLVLTRDDTNMKARYLDRVYPRLKAIGEHIGTWTRDDRFRLCPIWRRYGLARMLLQDGTDDGFLAATWNAMLNSYAEGCHNEVRSFVWSLCQNRHAPVVAEFISRYARTADPRVILRRIRQMKRERLN
jgi:hypothetical protein